MDPSHIYPYRATAQTPTGRPGSNKGRSESILTNRTGYILRHAGHYWEDDAGPKQRW